MFTLDLKKAKETGALATILTKEQIKALVKGYEADPAWLASVPTQACNTLYPKGALAFNGFIDSLFTHYDAAHEAVPPTTGINGSDRESCIIAILASGFANSELAIHMYWGIGEGMSVEQICQILLVSGGYNGYRSYVNGLKVLQTLLGALLTLFPSDGPYEPIPPQQVLPVILKAFASG